MDYIESPSPYTGKSVTKTKPTYSILMWYLRIHPKVTMYKGLQSVVLKLDTYLHVHTFSSYKLKSKAVSIALLLDDLQDRFKQQSGKFLCFILQCPLIDIEASQEMHAKTFCLFCEKTTHLHVFSRIEKKDNNGAKYIGILRAHHVWESTRWKTGERNCLNKWRCPNSIYLTTEQGES